MMIITKLALFLLGQILLTLPFLDNVDYDLVPQDMLVDERNLKLSNPSEETIELEDEENLSDEAIENLRQQLQTGQNINVKLTHGSLSKLVKGHCINGKNSRWMNDAEILEEFIKGPCAPVVLLPGIGGTSLQVEIQCESLKDNHPSIFEGCGWNTCSWGLPFFTSRPDTEYRIWMGKFFDPSTMVEFSSKDTCLGDLIQLQYHPDAEDKLNKHASPKGVRVTWEGNTPKTKKESNCGIQAITDLSASTIMSWAIAAMKGYHELEDILKDMGYISGVTMQAIPYDFRLAMAYFNTDVAIKDSLQFLNEMTGKKSVIIAHSYGGLHALNGLSKMTAEEKEKLVKVFVPTGSPLLGAPKVVTGLLAGDDDFVERILKFSIGVNYYSQNKFYGSSSSGFDMAPKDTFFKFKDSEWMQEILDRVNYEAHPEQYTDKKIPLSYFPEVTETCSETYFQARRDTKCRTGLFDQKKLPFVIIDGKEYNVSEADMQNFLVNESIKPNLLHRYLEAKNSALDDLQNPEVPTIFVYGAFGDTISSLEYANSTKEAQRMETFQFPDKSTAKLGDLTVLSTSAITPGIKWNYEYQNRDKLNIPNAKAVKFVEFCSNHQEDFEIYDKISDNGEKYFDNTVYHGLWCKCIKSKKTEDCEHAVIIGDQFYILMISNILSDNQHSTLLDDPNRKIYSKTELETLKNECPNLNSIRSAPKDDWKFE